MPHIFRSDNTSHHSWQLRLTEAEAQQRVFAEETLN
jgi:hypothetical protein